MGPSPGRRIVTVLPFRRPKKPAPPAEPAAVDRCSECGWKLPTSVRAFRDAVGAELLLRVDCPECGAEQLLLVEFT